MVFKKSLRLIFSGLIILFAFTSGFAQVLGDYRSTGDGNWNAVGTWQRWNGAAWAAPGANGYPGEFAVPTTVTIRAAHDVILNATVTINDLAIAGNTAVNGDNTSLTASVASGNPSLTLSGNLTATAGLISNTSLAFGGSGGLTIGGNATIGGGGFFGASCTFSSSGTMTVGGNITVQTISSTLTISGGVLTMGGNLSVAAFSSISFSTTGNVTVGGTTTIAAFATLTDSNDTGTSQFTGLVTNSGTWTSTAVNTTANLIFRGGIANAGTFSGGGATFDTNNQSITGGSNLSFANNVVITAVTVTIANTGNLTITGTTTLTTSGGFTDSDNTGITTLVGNVSVGASTSFNTIASTTTTNLVFQGGITNEGTFTAGGATFNTSSQALTGTSAFSFANNVSITGITLTNSNIGNLTISGTTTLTNGGFTDNDNTGITTFVGSVAQSGTSTFNTTVVVTSTQLIFRGGIANLGGTFTAGGATFDTNSQDISGNNAISFANFVTVTGITVTNNNTFGVSLTRVAGGITLAGTGTWTQGAGSILNYTGTSIGITNFNASTAGNTVNYNSTAAAQTIRVPSSTYSNLTFNNTFGTSPQFTVAGNISVTDILTMTAGNIDLNSNTLTLSSTNAGALIHGLTSASGWMYGGSFSRAFANTTAIAVGDVSGGFPLGSSVDWRPFFVGVNSIAGTAGTITVSHTNATTTSDVIFPESIVRRHDSFWSVATSGISAGTWDLRSGGTNFGTIEVGAAGLADLRMSTAAGVVGTHGAATGGPDYRVNRTAVPFADLVNNYHLASTDAVNSPLPIELVDFTANVINDGVELRWVTESELNNDFFTVERSSSGEVFSSIGQVNGSGTTGKRNTYKLIDLFPLNGISYYRLKQADFDGTFTYSKIISVTYEGPHAMVMQIYPNPSNGVEINIKLKGLGEMDTVPVIVYDHLGKVHAQFVLTVDDNSGYIQQTLTFEKPLPEGVYILKAGPTLYLTKRLIVTD